MRSPFILRRVLRRSDRGAVSIEYALLGAVVALGIVASLIQTKGKLNDLLGLITIRFGVVQQDMSRDTRTAVSTVQGSYRSNNVDYKTTTVTFSDGTRDVLTVPAMAGTGNFLQRLSQYDATGKIAHDRFDYPNGVWGDDVYTARADGSNDITNTTSSGQTYVYNARTYTQDGYTIYARHMLSASTPLYQDVVQVTDTSNPSNPILVGEATRAPNGTVTYTGSVDGRKYLP